MLGLVTLVACATVADSLWPRRETFTDFDGAVMGRLDAEMWRSYYERRPVSLFRQLARGESIGAADWEAIQDLLVRGWAVLSTGVRSR